MRGNARAAALAALGAYQIWRWTGRGLPPSPPDLRLEGFADAGSDRGRGNLVGIQPYMLPEDYSSEERFRAKLDGYFAAAGSRGWLGSMTIAVLPEDLGLWLVAMGERRSVYRSTTVQAAMVTLVLSHPLAFLRHLALARAKDRPRYAVFRAKAARMAAAYHRTLSGLARAYGVTVVGGSTALPSPRVRGGRLRPGRGRLYNVCPVYRPDGRAYQSLALKAYPVPDEVPFIAAATSEPPVYHTPAGRLGVLICADSWFPGPYESLRRQGVEIVAVPSYAYPDRHWHQPWAGYAHSEDPGPLYEGDAGRLTSREAWRKYALAGRLAASGARHGMNVFLRGCFWDLGSDGQTLAVRDGEVVEGPYVDGATLTNVWL